MEFKYTVRPMKQEDIAACAHIASFAPDPWHTEDFVAELASPELTPLVAAEQEKIVGFACFSQVGSDAELRMMAVDPLSCRKGIGRLLLAFGIRHLARNNAGQILLEVRASNTPALLLYQSMGFVPLTRRKNLYTAPLEDGFTLCRKL